MLEPPFKLATTATAAHRPTPASRGSSGNAVARAYKPVQCCEQDAPASEDAGDTCEADAALQRRRIRLADMDQFLHCSVLGTCLGTAELRKLMGRFIDAATATDVDVHHEAVWMAGQNGPATKALQKALDQRHAVALQRFAAARDEAALTALWTGALAQGDIPGAYWAVLTHRDLTSELRKRVFGDVHMLSHLVGAANRADIRRLVAIERENADLRERLDKQQQRSLETIAERNAMSEQLQTLLAEAQGRIAPGPGKAASGLSRQAEADAVALQTHRRELAEAAAMAAQREAAQLRSELDHLRRHADELGRELAAAELQLRESGSEGDVSQGALDGLLRGQRIFYVGGRPSSTPAIRDLVVRHGGEIRRHDGGLEDRKGMLSAGVAWASLVVFPVDCIDHDSALNLKRICMRLGVPFVPLRTASVASFASGLMTPGHAPAKAETSAQEPPPLRSSAPEAGLQAAAAARSSTGAERLAGEP